MKIIITVVIIMVVIVLILGALASIQAWRRGRALARHPWELKEEFDSEQVILLLRKPLRDDLTVGEVSIAAPDFDEQLWEARVKAYQRLYIMNEGMEIK